MIMIRVTKIVLVAIVAAFFSLVAFGNITDYDSNWQFVRHVLSMDTIFPDSTLRWRAIENETLQTIAYWGIIAWEAATALVLWIGVVRMARAIAGSAQEFAVEKPTAVVGLAMGFALYSFGFIVIGGEWFAMWQSETWNGQQNAFNMLTMIGIVLAIALLPEGRLTQDAD